MPINNITQTVSTIPAPPHRGVDVQTQFVIKQEDFQDHLADITIDELNTLKDQLNTRIGEINSTTTTINGYATSASSSATTATTKAGEASTSAGEALSYKNQAETFKNNASASATKASQWADNNYNVEVEAGKYSAKHWSTVAQNATANKVDKVASTDNAVVRFDGATGQVQNSSVTVDDNGNISTNNPTSSGNSFLSLKTAGTERASLNINGASGVLSLTAGYGGQLAFNTNGSEKMRIDFNGNLLLTSGTGGLGYGTGAGGTVTQLTSKATTVTLNKPSGRIIMHNAALADGASVYFVLNNNLLEIGDTVVITNTAWGAYSIRVGLVAGGFAVIYVTNTASTTYSEAIPIIFSIIKGAIS